MGLVAFLALAGLIIFGAIATMPLLAKFIEKMGEREEAKEREEFRKRVEATAEGGFDPSTQPEALPDGGMILTFGPDGERRIQAGSTVVDFNVAAPEPDPDLPREEPLAIATDLAKRKIGKLPVEHFAEAWCALVEAGAELPKPAGDSSFSNLVCGLLEADESSVATIVREHVKPDWWRVVYALVGLRYPEALLPIVQSRGAPWGWQLVHGLARSDPKVVFEARNEDSTLGRIHGLGELVALGVEYAPLDEAWRSLESAAEDNEEWLLNWRDYQVQKLASEDVNAACELFDTARAEWGKPDNATTGLYEKLAIAKPGAARDRLKREMEDSPEPYDWLPELHGCHRAGLDVSSELADIVDRLSGLSYRPTEVFSRLLDIFIRGEDVTNLERLLTKAGAHRWQTASDAIVGVRRLAQKGSPKLDEILQLLLAQYEPGPIAARDSSTGLTVGQTMIRPPEMSMKGILPGELLVLQTGLRSPWPKWYLD